MKKTIIAAAVAALAFAATPVVANEFTGVRVGVTAGVDDLSKTPDKTDITYGAVVGFDVGLTDKVIAGVEANVDNVFERRNIGASARLGYAVTDKFLVYGKAGYDNYSDVFSKKLDGLRVGGGVEIATSENSYIGLGYNYTDFEAGAGKHAVSFGAGLRF